MSNGRGKIVEDLRYNQVVPAVTSAVAATLYNGSAISVSNNGIDTRPYDEINFIINTGTFVGAAALNCSIMHSATNNPSTATLVSGNASPNDTASTAATFTQVTTANDAQIHNGSIRCSNFNRYMWLRSNQNAHTVPFSALAVLGKGDSDPASNSPVFDLNY